MKGSIHTHENPDEERRTWNDETIVPKIINGRADDERCNKPWDWYYSPYR
jgi:dTDP-4-dehydrorhamnose 3,5-epimerase